MVLLYLHQYFALPSCSAAGTRSYDLAKRFKSSGYKVIVLTTSAFLNNLQPFKSGWTILNVEEIEIHVLHAEYSNKLKFSKRIIAFVKFILYASARILQINCNVVLATSTPITIAVPALVKKYLHKVPFIFEVRDVWPEVPVSIGVIRNKLLIRLLNYFEQWVYAKSSHIVPLSDDMRTSILKYKVQEEKLTVIPNISETDRFSVFNPGVGYFDNIVGYKPEKVVLYAGTLGLINGIKYMVDLAYYCMKVDPDIKFIIIGDGMEKEGLMQYAAEKEILNKNLYFQDPVPKSQLAQIYYESTVATSFVIPIKELWSNSANKFFDCLAAGRPIVINHGGWQAEVINTEGIGFVLNWDVHALEQEAHRFCCYLNDSSLLKEQGARAKCLAEREYSLTVASTRYSEVLSNVTKHQVEPISLTLKTVL